MINDPNIHFKSGFGRCAEIAEWVKCVRSTVRPAFGPRHHMNSSEVGVEAVLRFLWEPGIPRVSWLERQAGSSEPGPE